VGGFALRPAMEEGKKKGGEEGGRGEED